MFRFYVLVWNYIRGEGQRMALGQISPHYYRQYLMAWAESLPRGRGVVERALSALIRRHIAKEIKAATALIDMGVVAVGRVRK